MSSTQGIQGNLFTTFASYNLAAQKAAAQPPTPAPQAPARGSFLQEAEETVAQTRLEAASGDQQAILKLAEDRGFPTPGLAARKVGGVNLTA